MGVLSSSFIQNIFVIILIIPNYFQYNCQAECPSSVPNIASVNYTFINNLFEPVLDLLPIFDNNTVPNFTTIVEEFQRGLDNEDIYLNITQLLTKYGYPVEQYEVETSDGYLLTLFRIPGNGSQVLVMHGLLCSAVDFVSTGPNRGLAYLLSNKGHDVWLGNARGNQYSRHHVTLSPNCKEFWDFTWDEIGRYDLPAMIDFILNKTRQSKLVYVGHSQGTTSFFVMASERPEYNDKITVMIALSAVTFLQVSGGPLFRILAPFSNPINLITQAIGLYEFLPRNPLTELITSVSCGTPISATVFCNNLVFIAYGFDYAQINATNLPVFFGHFPAGVATKQIVHYGQLISTPYFRKFNMGPKENFMKYGSLIPPSYQLEKITTKLVIFNSDNDWLAKEPDLQKFISKVPNVVENYRVPFAQFTHFDFLYAKDLKSLVNDKVLEFIEKYR